MRKLLIAVVAIVAVGAVAGVAIAANTYEVTAARGSGGQGTMKKPIPTKLEFGYRVGDTENMRPLVISRVPNRCGGHALLPTGASEVHHQLDGGDRPDR